MHRDLSRVLGSGRGSGFRGLGFRGLGFRGLGFEGEGLGFKVLGSGDGRNLARPMSTRVL